MPDERAVQITPEEIIHLLLEEMEQGTSPSYYSDLVPSMFDVYLYIDDLERIRPLESRIRNEAIRALNERLAEWNRVGKSKFQLPIGGNKTKPKKYETLGEWSIQFHENSDDDAEE